METRGTGIEIIAVLFVIRLGEFSFDKDIIGDFFSLEIFRVPLAVRISFQKILSAACKDESRNGQTYYGYVFQDVRLESKVDTESIG